MALFSLLVVRAVIFMCVCAGELLDYRANAIAQISEECDFLPAGLADVGTAHGVDARFSCW